ncbi:hypothetical protein HWI79_1636 [Cryptosporidium felis]|nr:hypothetical protein HWI79_1636 [Cryptosporidium felis]
MRDEAVNDVVVNSEEAPNINTSPSEEVGDCSVLEENAGIDKGENGSNSAALADEMIVKAISMRKKKLNTEISGKIYCNEKLSDSNLRVSSQSQIFTERPFFQRLTDSIYRRLIIGSSNQIKLVGLISAARLLVHLYESNTLEIPQNEQVQHKIPLLNCHVGDWQPVDTDRVVLSRSNISKDLLGCSKAPHAPPLVNRTRNIYVVTPLNYDGNKVGGGYRGGGSDPLSRLVMKWRNLSVSDIQDFTYVTENGFDLKYNGFYILYAKSNKPDSQWKQFYSARMRTNAFNSRHQILINSTHSSKLIKLHTVHLQKDGSDLPIGMALFEDHTESLTTEDFRKEYSFQSSSNEVMNTGTGFYENKRHKGFEKQIQGGSKTREDSCLFEGRKDVEFKKLVQTYPGVGSSGDQSRKRVTNKDPQAIAPLENAQVADNRSNTGVTSINGVFPTGTVFDHSLISQNPITGTNLNISFAKDSLELSLLLNFRSLTPKLQTELLHAISCIRFLNQDIFSTVLRSALDAACVTSGITENGLVSLNNLGFTHQISQNKDNVEKSKTDLPLFIRLLQENNSESLHNGNGNFFQDTFTASSDSTKTHFTGYTNIDNMNLGFISNFGNSVLPMFWSSVFGAQQLNSTQNFSADRASEKANPQELNNSSVTSDSSSNFPEVQDEVQTPTKNTPVCKPIEN